MIGRDEHIERLLSFRQYRGTDKAARTDQAARDYVKQSETDDGKRRTEYGLADGGDTIRGAVDENLSAPETD